MIVNNHIFVDVDGTLLIDSLPNTDLIEWIKEHKKKGFDFTLWSARGADHALNVAQCIGVDKLFDRIISKPAIVIDDNGWRWTRYSKMITDKRGLLPIELHGTI